MKIAIIGSGNMGRALSTAASKAGHSVSISAAHADKAQQVATETGARATDNRSAAQDADLVLLAVPGGVVGDIVRELADALRGKTVVDLTNRVNVQDPGQTLDGSSGAEQIQAQVPEARVTKAFNTIFAATFSNPVLEGQKADAFVAGDDPAARRRVIEFAESIGFRGVDAGPLPIARVLEGMAALNIYLQIWNGWPWQTGWKLLGRTA